MEASSEAGIVLLASEAVPLGGVAERRDSDATVVAAVPPQEVCAAATRIMGQSGRLRPPGSGPALEG